MGKRSDSYKADITSAAPSMSRLRFPLSFFISGLIYQHQIFMKSFVFLNKIAAEIEWIKSSSAGWLQQIVPRHDRVGQSAARQRTTNDIALTLVLTAFIPLTHCRHPAPADGVQRRAIDDVLSRPERTADEPRHRIADPRCPRCVRHSNDNWDVARGYWYRWHGSVDLPNRAANNQSSLATRTWARVAALERGPARPSGR